MSYKENAVKAASKKKALASGAMACALALACGVPAFAAETTSSTDIYLQMGEVQQLSVTAPTEINYSLSADGTFICPDADSVQIVNKSNVPVKVVSTSAEDQSDGALHAVSQQEFASTDAANAWWNQAQLVNSPSIDGTSIALNLDNPEVGPYWTMSAAGGESDTLGLATSGAMKNMDGKVSFDTKVKISKVTWTFAADDETPAL